MPTKQSYPTTSHHLHMKLPSSYSYSSPSSSSAASYHLNSDAAAAAGCFSGILRRLLCGTLDVGSSSSSSRSRVADAGTDGTEPPEKDHGISLKPPAPGIVARLMGLDSMPELPSAHPIGRSRSTGSLVLLPVPSTSSHRRSHSFREAPTFLRPENDEFLLLSFSPENNCDETKKIPQPRPTPAPNHSMGLRQLDQRDAVEEETRERPSQTERPAEKTTPTKQQQQKKKTTTNAQRKTRERPSQTQRSAEKIPTKQQQIKKKKTIAQRKTSREKTTTHREAPERTRRTKKKKSSVSPKSMAAELDGSSQNSSPVSVLDRRLPELDGESFTDTSTPISDEEEEEEPRSEGSPRRKLSSPVDCFDDPSQFFHLILVDDKEGSISMATTDQERRGAGTGDAAAAAAAAAACLPHSSSHLWTEASRLAVGDAQRQPWKAQDPEELVAEFGLQILESLLLETVDEFCHDVPSAK